MTASGVRACRTSCSGSWARICRRSRPNTTAPVTLAIPAASPPMAMRRRIGSGWGCARPSRTRTSSFQHQIGRDDPHDVAAARRPLEPLGEAHRLGCLWCTHRRDGVCSGDYPCRVRPWGLRREYTLFDETSVWKQILLREANG